MAPKKVSAPLAVCSRCLREGFTQSSRGISTSSRLRAEAQVESISTPAVPLNFEPKNPRTSMRTRRRQAVIEQLGDAAIPFHKLPYQCFQEARKVLLEDREEKLKQIGLQRARMERLKSQECAPQDEARKEHRIKSMRTALEELKIHADINDPLVKKKFEDGQGDMSKPIYRYLADRKWRDYERKIVMQRIEQMKVVPDVLPTIDPVVSTRMKFRNHEHAHGEILNSMLTETAPRIDIQPYDRGERLVTIAVVNLDVPNVADDSFTSRCHFLASNVSISPIATHVDLATLDASQILQSWHPAYSQKGLPYQRLAVVVLEQPAKEDQTQGNRSQSLDLTAIKAAGRDTVRENFSLRAFCTRHRVQPVGIDLFRTVYDENTAGVMHRAGIAGGDVEFKRMRVEPLPYKRKPGKNYR